MSSSEDRAGARGRSWLALDSLDMLGHSAALPDHLEAALADPPETGDLPRADDLRAVVVAGMGGSGVAGQVLQALADRSSRVPVVLSDGYELPRFVSRDTLVIAVSFSGATEETLAAARAAREAGAPLLALTTGGPLAELTESAVGAPSPAVLHRLPPGIPQPRAGIGAMVAPLLLAAEDLGLLPGAAAELDKAAAQLRRRLPECLAGDGLAAEVARRIGRAFPLVHGGAGLGAVAARRWKTQVNENAKAPAFSGSEPEVCHNEICGFGLSGDVTRQVLVLVTLRLGDEHPQVRRRFELFEELAGEALAATVEVEAEGDGELARFFDLVMLGDFVSLHLAAHDGVDPGPVPILSEVKDRLAAAADAPA